MCAAMAWKRAGRDDPAIAPRGKPESPERPMVESLHAEISLNKDKQ
jgi:hypothetical protein